MPSLAAFLQVIFGKALGVFVSMFGQVWGIRLAAATAMAIGYVSCVVYFSSMVGPWMAGVFSTAYGALLGLLFPPVSGTVLASLAAYWTCVITLQYSKQLWKAVTG